MDHAWEVAIVTFCSGLIIAVWRFFSETPEETVAREKHEEEAGPAFLSFLASPFFSTSRRDDTGGKGDAE